MTSTACGEFDCNGMMCSADQICVQRIGGAFLVECEENPCGEAPVEPACACIVCGTFPCTVDGRTVSCQTCPKGMLCP